MNPQITVVVPTFNEKDIIVGTLERIAQAMGGRSADTEIIIADDGSDDLPEVVDRIKAALASFSVMVLRNKVRLGKGAAIAHAFAISKAPIVGFIDADLSTDPIHIVRAVADIESGADIVIGSRSGDRFKTDPTFLTSIAGSIFHFISEHLLFRRSYKPKDTQCGFKFFKRAIAIELYKGLIAKDGLVDLEVLIRADRAGYTIKEIPLERSNFRESRRKLGKIFVRETICLCRLILRYAL